VKTFLLPASYTYGFIGLKRLGVGQMYLISIKDKDGNAFDGSKTYKVTVPPNASRATKRLTSKCFS
jgi:hypothetical protein